MRTFGLASCECRRDAFDKLFATYAFAPEVSLVAKNPGDFAAIPGLRVGNCVAEA